MPFPNYYEECDACHCKIIPYDMILNQQDVDIFKLVVELWRETSGHLLPVGELFDELQDRYKDDEDEKIRAAVKGCHYGVFTKLYKFGLMEHVKNTVVHYRKMKRGPDKKIETDIQCVKPSVFGELFYDKRTTCVDRVALRRRENLQDEEPLPMEHEAWKHHSGPMPVQRMIDEDFDPRIRGKNDYGRDKDETLGF